MDITINSVELADVATPACRIASRVKAPRIGGVLISATDEVRVQATDGNESIVITAHANVDDGGAEYLPAVTLGEIVKSLPNGSVRIQSGNGTAVISSQHGATFEIPTFNVDDFAGVLKIDGEFCDCSGSNLAKAVSSALTLAASAKEPRESLRGVNLVYDGEKLTAMATDSYAGAIATVDAEHGRPFSAILPASFAQSVSKMTGHVRVIVNDGSVSVQNDRMIVSSRTVEGRYPSLARLFERTPSTYASVNVYRMVQSVARAEIAAGTSAPVVIETVGEKKIRVSAKTERGAYEETIECTATQDFRIALNASLFKRVLSTVEGTCSLEFVSAEKPLYVTAGGVQSMLAPVREGGAL